MRYLLVSTALLLAACPPAGECPPGWSEDDSGYCVLPDEDRIRLQVDPPPGCEEPSVPPPQIEDCAATYEGDLNFEDEAAMADFCADYECIRGGLTIGGTEDLSDLEPNYDITTLEPLSCLRTSRFLVITNLVNVSHARLPNLEQTDGGMNVFLNQGVTSVDLPALRAIGGDLSIQLNDSLETLSMPALERVGEFFLVRDNPHLSNAEAQAVRDQLCPDAVGAATTIAGNGAQL